MADIISAQPNRDSGPYKMVTPIAMGKRMPLNHLRGQLYQLYIRTTGDWWLNIDGKKFWIKILEA